jgi:hypothetical protein
MPSHFAVDDRLSDRDRAAFIKLIANARTTVQIACDWLQQRGYKVSHGAVANFIRKERRSAETPFAPKLATRNAAELRRQITEWCNQLPAGELAVVAGVAAYLCNGQMLRNQASLKGVRTAK